MATKEAMEALQKTQAALKDIGTHLRPFVRRIQEATKTPGNGGSIRRTNISMSSSHSLAQAQAAVALSVGTLRYMGARLRGLDEGRRADDPLRQELNHMRKVLVDIEKLGKQKTKKVEEKKADREAFNSEEVVSKAGDVDNAPGNNDSAAVSSSRMSASSSGASTPQPPPKKRKSPGDYSKKKRRKR